MVDAAGAFWESILLVLDNTTVLSAFLTGYVIFLVYYYGTNVWNKESNLEWTDRFVIGFIIGLIYVFIGQFFTLVAFYLLSIIKVFLPWNFIFITTMTSILILNVQARHRNRKALASPEFTNTYLDWLERIKFERFYALFFLVAPLFYYSNLLFTPNLIMGSRVILGGSLFLIWIALFSIGPALIFISGALISIPNGRIGEFISRFTDAWLRPLYYPSQLLASLRKWNSRSILTGKSLRANKSWIATLTIGLTLSLMLPAVNASQGLYSPRVLGTITNLETIQDEIELTHRPTQDRVYTIVVEQVMHLRMPWIPALNVTVPISSISNYSRFSVEDREDSEKTIKINHSPGSPIFHELKRGPLNQISSIELGSNSFIGRNLWISFATRERLIEPRIEVTASNHTEVLENDTEAFFFTMRITNNESKFLKISSRGVALFVVSEVVHPFSGDIRNLTISGSINGVDIDLRKEADNWVYAPFAHIAPGKDWNLEVVVINE